MDMNEISVAHFFPEVESSTLEMNVMVTMVQNFDPCMSDELRARQGQKLRYLERDGHWVLVADVDGRSGFIPAAYCRPTSPPHDPQPGLLQRSSRDSSHFCPRRSLRLSLAQRCSVDAPERALQVSTKSATLPTAADINTANQQLERGGKQATLAGDGSSLTGDTQIFCSLLHLIRLSKLRSAFKAAHAAHHAAKAESSKGKSLPRLAPGKDDQKNVLAKKDGGKKKKTTSDQQESQNSEASTDFTAGLYSPVHLQSKRKANQFKRSQSQSDTTPSNQSPTSSPFVRRRLGAFSARKSSRRRSMDESVLNLHDTSRDIFGRPTSGEYGKAQAYSPREAHMIFEKSIAPIKEELSTAAPVNNNFFFPGSSHSLPLDASPLAPESSTVNVSSRPWANSPKHHHKMQRSLTFNAARSPPSTSSSQRESLACCSDSDTASISSASNSSVSSFLRGGEMNELAEEDESPVFERAPLGSPSATPSRRFLVLFDYTATSKEEVSVATGDTVIQARVRTASRLRSLQQSSSSPQRSSDWAYIIKMTGGSGYVPAELLQPYRTGFKDGVSATAL